LKKSNAFRTHSLALILLVSQLAFGKPGDLIRIKEIKPINMNELNQIFDFGICPGVQSKLNGQPIRYFALTYETTNVKGDATPASAALLIPSISLTHFSVVSNQHGTIVQRKLAPSLGYAPSDGRWMGACYASQGYAVVEADYLGYGDSTEYHPYIHAETEATTSADALRAAKQAARQLGYNLDGKLFLAGYSQGGHVTMALHRYLEQRLSHEFTVTASAPMAGPYEPAETIRTALQHPTREIPVAIAFLLVAYNKIYSLFSSLDDAILPSYTSNLETLVPGDDSMDQIAALLPGAPQNLLQPAFYKDFMSNSKNSFYVALKNNDVYDWKPTAPVMFIHGSDDIEVPTFNSTLAEGTMRNLGADTRLVWIQGKDHDTAVWEAISQAIVWFNSF
jgi:pimeloyl-ACP methyl ester carboxylesterase